MKPSSNFIIEKLNRYRQIEVEFGGNERVKWDVSFGISSELILGNRNFIPWGSSVQKLYDWDGLSMRIKKVRRTTKFVHLIDCQGGNNFLGILKKSI